MSYNNKEKQKEYLSSYYKENKDKYLSLSRNNRHKRAELVRLLKSKPCTKCDQSFPPCVMDFHHRDRAQKVDSINKLIRSAGIDRLLKELEKCDLLCANCHRILEFELSSSGGIR